MQEAVTSRLYLVVEQPVEQACGCGAQQVALQGWAGALLLCKQLAALQVQLQMLPAVLHFMCNEVPPASPTLQDQGMARCSALLKIRSHVLMKCTL